MSYYLLNEGFLESDSSCQHTYIDREPYTGCPALAQLPQWGTGYTYSSGFSDLVVSAYTRTLLDPKNSACGWKYVVTLSPINYNLATNPDLDEDLTTNMSMSAVIRSVSSAGNWFWESGERVGVDVSLPMRDVATTIQRQRYVFDTKIENFLQVSSDIAGCVNDAVFMNFPVGCVMYMGADVQELVKPKTSSTRKWQARLTFNARKIIWNKVWNNKTGAWEEVGINGVKLFQPADFSLLFSSYRNFIPLGP
jgi:hypothetical protein